MSTSDHAIIAHSGDRSKVPGAAPFKEAPDYSEAGTFTTSSPTGNGPRPYAKTTGDLVVEVWFNSATFMVSPHPERGNALAVTMQGHSMAIPVATVLIDGLEITEAVWETPFSGRPPEWQGALLDLVKQHGYPVFCHVLEGGGGA